MLKWLRRWVLKTLTPEELVDNVRLPQLFEAVGPGSMIFIVVQYLIREKYRITGKTVDCTCFNIWDHKNNVYIDFISDGDFKTLWKYDKITGQWTMPNKEEK